MDFQTNVTLSRFGDASFMTEEQLLSNRRMLENNSRCGYATFNLTATTKKGELVEYAFQCRPTFITYKQVRPNHASLRRAGNKSRVHDRFKRRPKLDWSVLDDVVLANDAVMDNAPTVPTATHAVRTGPSCHGTPNDAALVPVSSNGGHTLTLVPTEGRVKRAHLEVGDGGELVYTDYDGKTLILLHRTAQEAYEDGEEAYETFCERVACDPMWRDFTKDEVREHLSNEMCYSINEGFISYEYGIEIGHIQGYLHIGQKSIGLLDAIDCSIQTVSEWMELFEIECSASVRASSPYHIYCDGLLGGNRKAKQSKKPKSAHGASSNGRNVNAHRTRKPKPRSKEPSRLTIAAEISGSKTNKPHLSRGFQVNTSVAAVTNFVLDEQRYKTDLPITISCGPKGSMLLDLRDTFKSFATRASTLKQQEPTTCLTKYAKVTPKSVTLHFEMLNEVTGSIGVMSFSSDEYMPTDDVPSFIAARAMVKNSDCFVVDLKGKKKFAVTLPVVGGIHGFDEQFVNIVAFAYTDLLVKQTGWAGVSASEPADIVAGSRYSLAMVTCKYNYAGVYYAPRNVDDSQLRREIAIPYTTTTMGVAHTPANAEFASTTFSGTLVAGLAPPSPPQTAAQLVVMSDAAGDHTADLFITLLEKYNPEVEPVIEHALRVVCNVGGMMLPGWMTTVIDTTARVVNYIISDNAKDKIAANGLPDTYAVQSMPEYVSCSGVSSTSPTSNPYSCARTSIYQNIMDQLPTHGNLTAGYKLWQTLVQLQQDKGFYPEVTARNTGQTEPGLLAFSGFIPQRADGTVFNLLQDELYMPSGIPDSIGPVPSAALPHDVQYGLRVESTNDEAQLVILSAMNDGSVDDPQDYWRAHNLPFTVTSMLDVGHLFGETTMNGSCHVTFSFEHIGEGSGPLHDPRVNTTGCFPWGVASALVQVQSPHIKFVSISDNHRVHYNSVSTGDRIRSPCFKAGDNPSLYRIRFNRYNLRLWDEAEHGPLDAPVGAMPLKDLTICGDVEKNPGPIPLAAAIAIWIAENVGFAAFWDLVTKKSDEAAVSFHEARQTALAYRYGSDVPPTDHMSPHVLAHTLYRPGSSCEGVCSLKAQICVDIMGASSERHLRFLQCLLIILSGDVEENPGPLNEHERKRPNVEITPEVSEDIAACLRLKLMEVVEAPPHEVLEEREQQRADSYDNLFFFGVHPRQFVPTTPPEYRPSRDRLRPNTLDAPMGWVRWADTLYDCPLYSDCPKRCSHCRLVPYGEIFTLDELVDDHCERSFVSQGQPNGTHGEYTCSDDMSASGEDFHFPTTQELHHVMSTFHALNGTHGEYTVDDDMSSRKTNVPVNRGASHSGRAIKKQHSKALKTAMTDKEAARLIGDFSVNPTPQDKAEQSKAAKEVEDLSKETNLITKIRKFLVKPKTLFPVLLGSEADIAAYAAGADEGQLNLLCLARRHMIALDMYIECCRSDKCPGTCSLAKMRPHRDVLNLVLCNDTASIRKYLAPSHLDQLAGLYDEYSNICLDIESAAIGGVNVHAIQTHRYTVARSVVAKLSSVLGNNCCPRSCVGQCKRDEHLLREIDKLAQERKAALASAEANDQLARHKLRAAALRDELRTIETGFQQSQIDNTEEVVQSWEYAARVHEVKVLSLLTGEPCCPLSCLSGCKRREAFIESIKLRWLQPKVKVHDSQLTDKRLDLNVQLSGISGWPLVVLLTLPILLTFIFHALWCYELLIASCALCLTYCLYETNWYSVTECGTLTPDQIEEVQALSTPQSAPESNPLGARKEKESFQLPELRFVEIHKRSPLSWMLLGAGFDPFLIWLEERPALIPLCLSSLTLGWMNIYLLSGLIIATTLATFPFTRRARKLISLEALTAYTSAEVIAHGGTLESFKVECMRLTRTLNNLVLPSALSFMVTNCDNVLNMTLDVATLVFHHRKNEEEWCGSYLKQRAPRNNSILWVWLDMVQSIFQPLLLCLVPVLHLVVLAATPLIMLHAMTQIVLPNIATQYICLVLALFSMGLRIRTQISEQHMMLCSELFTAFVAVCHRLTCRCRSGSSDVLPVDSQDEISDQSIETSSISTSGCWQPLTRMLRRPNWLTPTREQAPLDTGYSSTDSATYLLLTSSDSSTEEAYSDTSSLVSRETVSESEIFE